jgi:hypothetical protein
MSIWKFKQMVKDNSKQDLKGIGSEDAAGRCSHYGDLLWAGQSGDWILVGMPFSVSSTLALRLTQPPVEWALGLSGG